MHFTNSCVVYPGFDGRFTMRGKLRYVIKAKCYIFSYITSTVQFSYGKHYYSSANVDMSRICNHAMLEQTQPVESHGGITICGMYIHDITFH